MQRHSNNNNPLTEFFLHQNPFLLYRCVYMAFPLYFMLNKPTAQTVHCQDGLEGGTRIEEAAGSGIENGDSPSRSTQLLQSARQPFYEITIKSYNKIRLFDKEIQCPLW